MNGIRKKHKSGLFMTVVTLLACMQVGVSAEAYVDPELQAITIDEKLGQKLPLDLEFQDSEGKQVRLAEYFNREKPVVLVLGYFSCPMLCTFVLNQLTNCLKDLDFLPGDEFDILTISIDPIEQPALAAGKKKTYIGELDRQGASKGWHFLVGKEDQIQQLAGAVGFKYQWNERQQQYAHSAALILLSPDGMINRYLHGLAVDTKQLRLGLIEAGQGLVGSPLDGFFLRCFHYDPVTREYRIMATRVMQAGGILTVLFITSIIGGLLWKERRRKRKNKSGFSAPGSGYGLNNQSVPDIQS
jgi:protein SCO1/2